MDHTLEIPTDLVKVVNNAVRSANASPISRNYSRGESFQQVHMFNLVDYKQYSEAITMN